MPSVAEESPSSPHAGSTANGAGAVGDAEFRRAWTSLVETLRADRQTLLAGALSRGYPLSMEAGVAKVGYAAEDRMGRSQCLRAQGEIEKRLSATFSMPVALAVEEVSEDIAKNSMASVEKVRREDAESRQRQACLDDPAVVLVQRTLGAVVELVSLAETSDATSGGYGVMEGGPAGDDAAADD